MKLKANQVEALKKIADAGKAGLPLKDVHFRVRDVLCAAGLAQVTTTKKSGDVLTVTAEGRKAIKDAEKASKAKALVPA